VSKKTYYIQIVDFINYPMFLTWENWSISKFIYVVFNHLPWNVSKHAKSPEDIFENCKDWDLSL